ncbi:hypothetical protein MRX96_034989 [Rhipicephalus microplus]
MVVLARDPGDYYNNVFGDGMTEEASGCEKLNESEVSPNDYSDEASGVEAMTQAAKSVPAAVAAEAMEDAPEPGKVKPKEAAELNTKHICDAAVGTGLAAVDNEPFDMLQVSGMANAPRIGDCTPNVCEHNLGGSLR